MYTPLTVVLITAFALLGYAFTQSPLDILKEDRDGDGDLDGSGGGHFSTESLIAFGFIEPDGSEGRGLHIQKFREYVDASEYGTEESQTRNAMMKKVFEYADEDGDGMCDAFHLVGDWHLYGWDFVIGKADVLPLVSTVYEGVDVWVTQNPWAMALADYGNCVRYYPPAVHFFMIARPSWLLMAVLAALSTSVLFIVFERMATSKVSIRSVALVCGFALHSLHFLYLCLMEQLRSGFACLVVLLIVAGAPLVVAGNVAFRTHGAIPQNMHFLGTLALVAILATWALAPLWPILGYTACWLHEQLLMSPCAGPGETTLSGKLGQQFGYALSGNFKRL